MIGLAQQKQLNDTIEKIASQAKGAVGVAVVDLDTKERFLFKADQQYPMQSVYKFPLALAILHQVDEGKLDLDQMVHLTKEDLQIPYASPLREKYPEGNVDVSLADILRYTVSQSDNNGCDVLFRLAGGTNAVHRYIRSLGVRDINIAATEREMGKSWDVQYTNWCTPSAMADLLEAFYTKKFLSNSSTTFLWKIMTETVSAPGRIKGQLPSNAIVAHKPGTSSTNAAGVTAATNDVGIVELNNGRRFIIAVFIKNSTAEMEAREKAIAQIAKLVSTYHVHDK